MNNLFNRFINFSNTFYSMFIVKSKVKDDRKSPQIPPSVIFLNLLMLVLFKKQPFLQLDQFMRTEQAKRFIGSNKKVVVSDSTISRSPAGYHLQPLRQYLKTIANKASHMLGEANLLLDIEKTTIKGKEIPTTRTLLKRVFSEYGRCFVDIILLDALYADKETINLILSNNSYVLIKTREEFNDNTGCRYSFHLVIGVYLFFSFF